MFLNHNIVKQKCILTIFRCSLSHAEWRENLMLAEVTQNTGGHWQFMGHNIGKQLFLTPEETLFLMEIVRK